MTSSRTRGTRRAAVSQQQPGSAGPGASQLSGAPELDEIPSNRKQTRFASMSAGKRG